MSDNYIVSARKYRPQTFDTVVGQEHITTTLRNAIKNQHLAHAFLFCGPRGVGKTTCARILAKTINCESPTADMEACGHCQMCQSFKNSSSFNVFELDAASNNSVDDIRELANQVRFSPQQGKYKVYIIDEVHMLSASAFNAFLKTLEEPPPYAIFILATTEKHKILPTILSRCQIFDFKRITTHDIVAHLQSIAIKESMIAAEAALHIIAQKSEGCMRDALSMLDRIASFTNGQLTYSNTMEHLNLLDANYYFRHTDCMLSQDVSGSLLLLDQALEKGFEGDTIINGLAEHFRNLLLCKDHRMAKLLDVPNDLKPIYHEKALQSPPSFILSALNAINDSELSYKNATNKRLHVEMCLIRLCFLLQSVPGSQIMSGSPMVPQGNNQQGNSQQGENQEVKKNTSSVSYTAPEVQAPKYVASNTSPANPGYGSMKMPENMVKEPLPTGQVPIVHEFKPPTTTASPTGGSSKRVSMSMLKDIGTALTKAAENRSTEVRVLTEQQAVQLFEDYKAQLQANGKGVIHGQFSMMRVELMPPDEVKVISPNELTHTYANEQRTQLIDFYRAKTQMLVRIVTELIIDEEVNSKIPKVLSKSEMFEAMARKNPNLAKLKDGLGMQVEY